MRVKACRICKGKNLARFLDLGFHPPSDAFLRSERLFREEKKYPLDVFLCEDCGLVQLGYVVPPELMFNKEYVYVTSVSKTADRHFEGYAEEVMSRFCKKGDFVVEIGSNDGTLLKHFKSRGARVLGVDPSRAAMMAIKNSIETVNELFTESRAREIVNSHGKAQAIVGANVFAHINDLDDVLRGVGHLLKEGGVFVTEFPYLLHLVDSLEFDTIYHEHLSYFSLKPLAWLFKRFGMEIFDVTETPVHGGSVRLYVKRVGDKKLAGNLERLLEVEEKKKLYSLETYEKFARDVEKFKEEFVSLLQDLKRKGALIAGNGAPAKGNTLLNYCNIGPELIEFIAEINPLKHYTFTPGMHIPVLPLHSIQERPVDYMVIFPWNLKEDIMKQEHAFRDRGGKFIIPLPRPEIV